jgi:hypothetical protein
MARAEESGANLGLYISLEQTIPGVDPMGMDGRAAARAQFVLDAIAERLKVPTITSLLCADRNEVVEFLEDVGVDTDEFGVPDEHWFPAAEGLRSVTALLTLLRKAASPSVPNVVRVIADLEAMEKVLRAAEKSGIRFHFSMDLPL